MRRHRTVHLHLLLLSAASLAACGGGSGGSLFGGDTSPPAGSDVTAPHLTTVATMLDSTLPAVTAASPPTLAPITQAPTTVPPTTVPTTTPALLTDDQLRDALPTAAELPAGWTYDDDEWATVLEQASGPGEGYCGGINSYARAVANGVVGHVGAPGLSPDRGWALIDLFAFPDAALAARFVTDTQAQAGSCPDGVTWQEPESEIDVFSDDSDPMWTLFELTAVQPYEIPGGGQAIVMHTSLTLRTFTDREVGLAWPNLELHEQYGTVVLVIYLEGWDSYHGFDNDAELLADAYTPSTEDLQALADAVRPGILAQLP